MLTLGALAAAALIKILHKSASWAELKTQRRFLYRRFFHRYKNEKNRFELQVTTDQADAN
jgi:hypothetical protein